MVTKSTGFTNFNEWKLDVKINLSMNGLWLLWLNEKKELNQVDAETMNNWHMANSWICSLILNSVTEELTKRLRLVKIDNFDSMYEKMKLHIEEEGKNQLTIYQFN